MSQERYKLPEELREKFQKIAHLGRKRDELIYAKKSRPGFKWWKLFKLRRIGNKLYRLRDSFWDDVYAIYFELRYKPLTYDKKSNEIIVKDIEQEQDNEDRIITIILNKVPIHTINLPLDAISLDSIVIQDEKYMIREIEYDYDMKTYNVYVNKVESFNRGKNE